MIVDARTPDVVGMPALTHAGPCVEVADVVADEALLERLRYGEPPRTGDDLVVVLLAAWRDDVMRPQYASTIEVAVPEIPRTGRLWNVILSLTTRWCR